MTGNEHPSEHASKRERYWRQNAKVGSLRYWLRVPSTLITVSLVYEPIVGVNQLTENTEMWPPDYRSLPRQLLPSTYLSTSSMKDDELLGGVGAGSLDKDWKTESRIWRLTTTQQKTTNNCTLLQCLWRSRHTASVRDSLPASHSPWLPHWFHFFARVSMIHKANERQQGPMLLQWYAEHKA